MLPRKQSLWTIVVPHVVHLHVFRVVIYAAISIRQRGKKNDVRSILTRFIYRGFIYLCTYIGVQQDLPCYIMFVSFNRNTTGVSSGARTTYPFWSCCCSLFSYYMYSTLQTIACLIVFSFDNCFICLSLINGFWLYIWYLQYFSGNQDNEYQK